MLTVKVEGQLAIKTVNGRYGEFRVGRLITSIGDFVTKDPKLEQYPPGKYDGQFFISRIYVKPWPPGPHMGFDLRADLADMVLSGIEPLSGHEVQNLSPQEVDPIDEEAQSPPTLSPSPLPPPVETVVASDPLIDTTPFEPAVALVPKASASAEDVDAKLFGPLWPLGALVKLDATVDRRMLRQQRDRLDKLGYAFEPLSQDWHLKAA